MRWSSAVTVCVFVFVIPPLRPRAPLLSLLLRGARQRFLGTCAPPPLLRCKDEVFSKGSGLDEGREEKNTPPLSFVCVFAVFPLALAAEGERKLMGMKGSEKFVFVPENLSSVSGQNRNNAWRIEWEGKPGQRRKGRCWWQVWWRVWDTRFNEVMREVRLSCFEVRSPLYEHKLQRKTN